MKLERLPDRTPVKLTASFPPRDHADLALNAELYARTYGEPVPPAELVPSIVRAFLASDRDFKRMRKTAERGDEQ